MASPQPDDFGVDALREDAETRLEFLIEAGIFKTEDEVVATTPEYEDTKTIYADTYGGVSDEKLAETAADMFGVPEETALEKVESGEVNDTEVVTYLSLQSELDRDLPQDVLALLTGLAMEVGPTSAVPEGMTELTDDSYEAFLEEEDEAVVIAWSYTCEPCRELKGELPELREQLPESVTFAGVDGGDVVEFRREFEVDVAPTTLIFSDGELVETIEGYHPPEDLAVDVEALLAGDDD